MTSAWFLRLEAPGKGKARMVFDTVFPLFHRGNLFNKTKKGSPGGRQVNFELILDGGKVSIIFFFYSFLSSGGKHLEIEKTFGAQLMF